MSYDVQRMARTSPARAAATSARTLGDVFLFGVTAAELAFLALLTPAFTLVDWIYLSQHLVVLGIALTRRCPSARDGSLATSVAVVVAYAYPYAQMAYAWRTSVAPAWPEAGIVLVTLAAGWSFVSLLTLGKRFGIRPAWRGLVTTGPYRVVRHPMYLAYVLADVGYNLQGWNAGMLLLTAAGWASLVYRVRAEERLLSRDIGWPSYISLARYRLFPGVW